MLRFLLHVLAGLLLCGLLLETDSAAQQPQPETSPVRADEPAADTGADAEVDAGARVPADRPPASAQQPTDAERAPAEAARLELLEKSIRLEQELLETTRQLAAGAAEARTELQQQFAEKALKATPPAELIEIQRQLQQASAQFEAVQGRLAQHRERLEELRVERDVLLGLQPTAPVKTAAVEPEEATDERLLNPFTVDGILAWLFDHGPMVIGILVAMLVLQQLVRLLSARVTALMALRGEGSSAERLGRARTLAGVLYNAISLAIIVGGLLMILEEVGIPIAPLLGGAAVIGLAVAFGAQNLIRDYFSGFMILLENQYRLNDVIKIGDHAGQVEQITLRMTALRDLEGQVHFIPNGTITSVINLTHGWSRALFDIGVAYKEDPDRVMEVIMELGRELRQDPQFQPLILEDPTMLGVEALKDSAVVIRFFIKTVPLQQWPVKRELLRRIKKRFDELGIEIPFPHQVVYHRAGDGRPPTSLELQAKGEGTEGEFSS